MRYDDKAYREVFPKVEAKPVKVEKAEPVVEGLDEKKDEPIKSEPVVEEVTEGEGENGNNGLVDTDD